MSCIDYDMLIKNIIEINCIDYDMLKANDIEYNSIIKLLLPINKIYKSLTINEIKKKQFTFYCKCNCDYCNEDINILDWNMMLGIDLLTFIPEKNNIKTFSILEMKKYKNPIFLNNYKYDFKNKSNLFNCKSKLKTLLKKNNIQNIDFDIEQHYISYIKQLNVDNRSNIDNELNILQNKDNNIKYNIEKTIKEFINKKYKKNININQKYKNNYSNLIWKPKKWWLDP